MNFDTLNVSAPILSALNEMGFVDMTAVQQETIPLALTGRDLVAQAPTGTGKTCAFGIPMIEKLDFTLASVQALIICPTRELAVQITEELKRVAKNLPKVRFATLYGGQSYDRQLAQLRARPQIVVATPGRLMDHMRKRMVDLSAVHTVVMDEADEMLNMGFRDDMKTILENVPTDRQTLLFSATISPEILHIANQYQNDAKLVRVTRDTLTVPAISQYYVETRPRNKGDVLTRLIDANGFKLSLIFCNTKHMVDELTAFLNARGYPSEALHGDMKQSARDRVMNAFRTGRLTILVATDVAARGIDVEDIDAVFNFDIPLDEEYYVHRIGRTGRANKEGAAYTLCTAREIPRLRSIMRYTKAAIEPIMAPQQSEVERMKIESILENASEYFGSSASERTKAHIKTMLEKSGGDWTADDVAAALIRLALTPKGTTAELALPDEPPMKQSFRRERVASNTKPSRRDDGTSERLFINVGKMDNVSVRDIAKLVGDVAPSVGARNVRNISMYDKFSFLEVPLGKGETVVKALRGTPYKGRSIAIEKARQKDRD